MVMRLTQADLYNGHKIVVSVYKTDIISYYTQYTKQKVPHDHQNTP